MARSPPTMAKNARFFPSVLSFGVFRRREGAAKKNFGRVQKGAKIRPLVATGRRGHAEVGRCNPVGHYERLQARGSVPARSPTGFRSPAQGWSKRSAAQTLGHRTTSMSCHPEGATEPLVTSGFTTRRARSARWHSPLRPIQGRDLLCGNVTQGFARTLQPWAGLFRPFRAEEKRSSRRTNPPRQGEEEARERIAKKPDTAQKNQSLYGATGGTNVRFFLAKRRKFEPL